MTANPGHINLQLVDPPFGSKLSTLILDLDYLRKKFLYGSTRPIIFFQLKSIFHLLESIGSARIEGNRTTLAEYIERKIEGSKTKDEKYLEIENNERALTFIENNISRQQINRALMSQVHKIVTKNLTAPPGGEGSRNPGEYRKIPVAIANSTHVPPDVSTVAPYMEDLFNFINKPDPPQYDLLKVAIAHHGFAWIHPFDNGNGRVVRLMTYAMLVKYGFRVHGGKGGSGRILNPTAVFCSKREEYYRQLSTADKTGDANMLSWCEYVLSGLKNEISKIDKLLEYDFLAKKILLPAINFALDKKLITHKEFKILQIAARKQVIQAADVRQVLPGKMPAEISRTIRKLRDNKMLQPLKKKSRKYVLRFDNNYLLRGIVEMLDKENFLPIPINR